MNFRFFTSNSNSLLYVYSSHMWLAIVYAIAKEIILQGKEGMFHIWGVSHSEHGSSVKSSIHILLDQCLSLTMAIWLCNCGLSGKQNLMWIAHK